LFLSFDILRFSSIEFSRERRDMIVLSKAPAFPSIPASNNGRLVKRSLARLPLACVCARYSIIRCTKFEWAAAYRKTIGKIAYYRESTTKEFFSKLISVAQITEIHHNDNARDDTVVFDDVNLFLN